MTGDDLQRLMGRFEGTWRTEGVIVDGGERDGEMWGGYDIYEWFPGKKHMVHRVDVEIFGGRKEAIEVFTPRQDLKNAFDQISFDADGTVERATGSFDDEGRYCNDLGDARAVLTFVGTDSMTSEWEKRLPDGTWTPWMRMIFTRVAAPHIEIRSTDDHATA